MLENLGSRPKLGQVEEIIVLQIQICAINVGFVLNCAEVFVEVTN